MGLTPDRPAGPSGQRRTPRRLVVLLLGLAAALTGAFLATASTAAAPAPTMTVTPSNAYRTLVVTVDRPVFAASDGTGALTASSFELHGAAGKLSVALAVKALATTSSYELTVPASTTVVPNVTTVVVPTAYEADGTAVLDVRQVVPLTASDAVRTVAALSTVKVDGKPFAPLPFVGSWMASLQPVTGPASGGSQALREAAGADPVAPSTGDARSRELEVESTPIPLTRMVAGLAAALTEAQGLTTQAAVVEALEAVSGIDTVVFTGAGARVKFTPAENAGTQSSDQRTEIQDLRYAVDGTTSFALHLGGHLDLALPATGAARLEAMAITLEPRSLKLPAKQTVGLVAIAADATVTTDVSLGVTCAASCSATPTVTATGGVALDVEQVRITDGDGEQRIDVRHDGRPVRVAWSPGTWDLTGLALLTEDTSATAALLTAALAPEVTDDAAWVGKGLPQLDLLDSRAVTLGLEWVANWLRSTDGVEALGTQLPTVGLSVGDVLQLSDQVGARVTALVEDLEPDGTSAASAADPTAQDVLRALCAQDMVACDGGLTGLDIVVDGPAGAMDEVSYDVELDVCALLFGDTALSPPNAPGAPGTCGAAAGVPVEQAGPTIDLAGADGVNGELGDLVGITTTLRTGTWKGKASATLAFRLTLDLRPDALVAPGVGPQDYPGPGFPDTDRLAPGDLCRGLALELGTTETLFAAANDVLVDGQPTLACDTLAWDAAGALTAVDVPQMPTDASPSPADVRVTVTAEQVCSAAALKHGLQVQALLELNGFDAAACAARARLQVTSTSAPVAMADGEGLVYPVDAGDGAELVFHRVPFGQPLPVTYRLSVEPLGDTPFVAAAVDVRGTDLTGEVGLGFLDLDLTGTVTAAPTVEVGLPDRRLTLIDLAQAADSDTPAVTIGALLDTALGGDLDVDLDLTNPLAFPDGAAFELHGDPADLTAANADGVAVEADCDDLGADGPGLCAELGDWPKLTRMTPEQVQRTVTGLLDRLAGMTSAGDAALPLPMVGVSMQDLVGFSGRLQDLSSAVQTREPEDLSALQEALEAGLLAAGLPTGGLQASVDGDVFRLRLPLDVTERATYPFGFDVGFDDESPEDGTLPVRIAPADGGARITATGAAVFSPTFALDLSGAEAGELDDHAFLDVSADGGADLSLTGEVLEADRLAGDVTFGSLTSDLRGTASADPSLTLHLAELADADARVTLSRFDALLDPEAPAELPDGTLEWGGDLALKVSIKGFVTPFKLDWNAPLQALVDGEEGTFKALPDLDSLGVKLDLATLVGGTSQTARFVGRALAESDALSTSLPLVGDQLASLSSVGKDLQGFATTVDDLYAEVEANDEDFVAGINDTLADEVCAPISAGIGGACSAELVLFQDGEQQGTDDGPPVDVTVATGVELQLRIDREESLELGTPKLLDVPGFEVDTAASLQLRAGYRLGLTLGLDVARGFYVKGRDVSTEDEPDLSRLIEVYGRASIGGTDVSDPDFQEIAPGGGVKIGGVTAFTLDDLDMSLGGSFGPDQGDEGGNAAGFALDMPEPLTLMDVVNGRRSIDEIFAPKVSVVVQARLTIGTPSDSGGAIPTLAFPVFFDWAAEGVIGGGVELESPSLSIGSEQEDSYVTIDVTSLVDNVVKPALIELNAYNPVAQAAPIKDALNSQVPVLDQSVRGLLDGSLGQDPRWQLLSFLLDLDDVAKSLEATPVTGARTLIPLGGYTVLPREDAGYFSPPGDGTVWDDPALGLIKDLVTKLSASAGGSKKFAKPAAVTPKAPGTWDGTSTSSSTTAVSSTPLKRSALKPVVSMPILDNPLSAATLLFGGEVEPVSFIEIAPPAVDFGMSVKFERTLFDLNLGAIEARLAVGLQGAVGVTLRVGLGYSSHGLTSGDPLNGLYLVDAYDGNRALPMVALGGRVAVRVDGRFSVADIAEATFSGSGYVRLEGGLDLFDESLVIPEAGRGDGMFHVDEMLRVVDGHRIGAVKDTAADLFCIFRPTVELQAGLAFSASAKLLGIEVWSGSFAEDYDLVDEEWSCPYVERVAQLVDRTVVLAAGPTSQERLDDLGDVGEQYTVTQAGGTLTVAGTAGGPFAGYRPMSFPLDGIDEVTADLGEGADVVRVAAGVTVPVHLYGGPGNDVLEGGDGDDVLDGGDGVDTLTPRGGDDEVVLGADGVGGDRDLTSGAGVACTGCNVVVLGLGEDTVQGGPAPVAYRTTAAGFGRTRIEHTGPTMVLDLAAYAKGVDAVVDGLGLHVTSPDGGSVDTADPTTLARLGGSGGADRIRVADGPLGMHVDGGGGADTVTVETNGDDRTARVSDSGTGADSDRLLVRGTSADDRFLLRAHVKGDPPDTTPTTPADEGVVAVLSPESKTLSEQAAVSPASAGQGEDSVTYEYTGAADATQLVLYDSSIESLHVDGVAGADTFALDDVATITTVEGGRAAVGGQGSRYQVGQLYGWTADEVVDPVGPQAAFRRPTSPERPVTPWEEGQFRYRESIRGWLSYGISHPTTVRGGDADDAFTVYSNRSELTLEGGAGDDVFTLRSFIANGTIAAAGEGGDDTFKYDFEYVANDDVDIDGGEGANTFVAIGTELQDGFAVTQQGVSVCVPGATGVDALDARVTAVPGITALPVPRPAGAGDAATGVCSTGSTISNVQRYVLYGLAGNDVFWVRGTPEGSETFAISGTDGSTFLLGDAGDLSGLEGRVEVVGDLNNLSPAAEQALQAVDLAFPLPVLLDGEVAYSAVDALLPGDAVNPRIKHTAVVDGTAETDALIGSVRADAAATGIDVTGLSTAGVALGGLDTVRLVLGAGGDELDVAGTLTPYIDRAGDGALPPSSRLGRTEVYTGAGDDEVQVDAVDGPAWFSLEAGDDELRAGTGTASGLRAVLEVLGGAGRDDVEVDAGRTGQRSLRADLDRRPEASTWTGRAGGVMGVLTGLDVPVTGLVQHDASVEVFRVETGDLADVVNVRGSVAGSTQLRTAGGDDAVFVSDAARQPLAAATSDALPTPVVPGLLRGRLDALVGGLDVGAGAGDNLLMVSDRDTTTARDVELTAVRVRTANGPAAPTVTMRKGGIAVTGLGPITFDAEGTFAQGVTTWLGSGDDRVVVSGTRRDGVDPGVLAWDVPSTVGSARTITTLSTGAGKDVVTATVPRESGPVVLNLEEGDDRLLGDGSAGRLVAFGGDGLDDLQTGAGDDLVFGDWGRVDYGAAGFVGVPTAMDRVPRVAAKPVLVASCTAQRTVVDGVLTACDPAVRDPATGVRDHGVGAEVRNRLSLGAGDDVGIGGGGSDWIEDTAGSNALVGDHGSVQRVAPSVLGGTRRISGGGAGFVDVTVLEDPFAYVVDVLDALGGSADVVLGGSGRDRVFAGLGDDLVNGRDGSDLVFGGDGLDALWGGSGDDRVYAGYGADLVDLKAGVGAGRRADYRDGWPIGQWWAGKPLLAPATWPGFVSLVDTDRVAATDNGSDVVFGGDGPDALQADLGGAGPVPGDRLVDGNGAFNVYFVCQGAYGAGYVQRAPSPTLRSAFEQMATADGAAGANGARQLAVPGSGNTSPAHPAHPGNNHGC